MAKDSILEKIEKEYSFIDNIKFQHSNLGFRLQNL